MFILPTVLLILSLKNYFIKLSPVEEAVHFIKRNDADERERKIISKKLGTILRHSACPEESFNRSVLGKFLFFNSNIITGAALSTMDFINYIKFV